MIIDQELLELQLLPQVEKPAQYAGGEMNSVLKDWDSAPVRMAFAFPDAYEIGMSHLGGRLLYEAVNNHSPYLMERVFLPLPDMQALLRKLELPLFSLESRHELADFDLIGFTLQYELSFTNILAMLDLGRIPLLARERSESDPIVALGGPCAYNAEPLADVADLVFLGEGEQLDIDFLDLLAQAKIQGWSREQVLARAVAIPGLYVPKFYQPSYSPEGTFTGLSLSPAAPPAAPLRIEKRVVEDFDAAPFPAKPILPNIRPVHDRIMLEVMRGCTHGCRFYQAGVIYRPRREKTVSTLSCQAAAQCAASGYEDIALLSLSTADYTGVEPLMDELNAAHAAQGVGLSLPSLRVDAFSVGLASRTQEVRKSGLTLAPEAGSQRLRDAINKGVVEADILAAAAAAFSQGYSHIKLYFMLGLPYESDSDILAIAQLCRKILRLGKENKPAEVKKPLRMSLGVSCFIPKSHTPFQWQAQDPASELMRKQDLLKQEIKPMRQITVNYHDRRASLLEAAFARGDRRLGPVLLEAYRRGCLMDAWSEHFRFDLWQEAFAACGLTPEQFANRQINYGEALPWSHLSCGVDEAWLWRENIRAGRAELTPDCSRGECSGCGVCAGERQPRLLDPEQLKAKSGTARPAAPGLVTGQGQYRYRLQLALTGAATWVSHLDLLGMAEKALRRSALPVAYSQGFNPHMLISWGPAHPVGLASQAEYADVFFTAPLHQGWMEQLSRALPPGLSLIAARAVSNEAPPLMAALNYAVFSLDFPGLERDGAAQERLDGAIEGFLSAESVLLERSSPKGRKTVDIRPAVQELSREGGTVRAELWLDRGAAVKMNELARLLLPEYPCRSRRLGLYIAEGKEKRLP